MILHPDVPVEYLALDPGYSTGWAAWDNTFVLTGWGTEKGLDELSTLLQGLDPPPKVIIYEEFKLFPNKAISQVGSDIPAAQAIGAIKAYASIHKIETHAVRAGAKQAAEAITQMKRKHSQDKNRHWIDAYNHGVLWLIHNRGYIPPNLKDRGITKIF